TTVGQALFTLTNPSAITFVRMNADNSVTARSAANFRTDLGLGTMAVQDASAVAITGGTLAGLTGLAVRDTSAAFDLTLAATSTTALTAGRTFTVDVDNGSRTLKLQANLTVTATATLSGTNTGDQVVPANTTATTHQ